MKSDCYFEECKDCMWREHNDDLMCCLGNRLGLAWHKLFLELPFINKFIGDRHCYCFEKKKSGHWIYWDGWIGNTVQRIDDAVCSNCGYKHPTVWWTKGDKHNSTPDKLADVCPNCGAFMNKWAGKYKEDLKT